MVKKRTGSDWAVIIIMVGLLSMFGVFAAVSFCVAVSPVMIGERCYSMWCACEKMGGEIDEGFFGMARQASCQVNDNGSLIKYYWVNNELVRENG